VLHPESFGERARLADEGPAAHPDTDRRLVPQSHERFHEVLRCLLEVQPAHGTDHRDVRCQPEQPTGGRAGDLCLFDHSTVHDWRDGAQRVRARQTAPQRLGRHTGADRENRIGDPGKTPLHRDIGGAAGRVLERVEREAVVGVHQPGHPGPARGPTPHCTGLRAVRVHDVELTFHEQPLEAGAGDPVVLRGDGRHEARLDEDLVAGLDRDVGERPDLSGDERDPVPLGVERQHAAQRHPAGACDEPGDDLRHLDRRGGTQPMGEPGHRTAPVARIAQTSRSWAARALRSERPGVVPSSSSKHGTRDVMILATSSTFGRTGPRPVASPSTAVSVQNRRSSPAANVPATRARRACSGSTARTRGPSPRRTTTRRSGRRPGT
jgi:hypothetical protein